MAFQTVFKGTVSDTNAYERLEGNIILIKKLKNGIISINCFKGRL